MPVDLTAIRALLASVAGFTKGPWRIAYTAGQGGIDSSKVYTDAIGEHPFCIGDVNRYRYVPEDQKLFAAAPDLHRELTEAVGEIEIRDRQQAGTQAMLEGIWRTLDAAGVRDDVDERYMQQVSEHCYEPAGEHRQADPEERVGFLAAEVVRLRAHNARMVALLNVMADALQSERGGFWDAVSDHVGTSRHISTALRRLAAGEVDDG